MTDKNEILKRVAELRIRRYGELLKDWQKCNDKDKIEWLSKEMKVIKCEY